MKLQNCVYKLSVSSNKYPLLITMFHSWSKHNFIRNVMSCHAMSYHVCLLSPGLCLDHIQQSALNRFWYALSFVPWDSVCFLSVRTVSHCKQLQYLAAFYTYAAGHTQQNSLIYNLQHWHATSHILFLKSTAIWFTAQITVWVHVSLDDSEDRMTLHIIRAKTITPHNVCTDAS
jgi:hypothetical protein